MPAQSQRPAGRVARRPSLVSQSTSAGSALDVSSGLGRLDALPARPPEGDLAQLHEAPSPLDRAGAADLLLQQHHTVKQGLRCWRTTRYVDIDRYDPVAAAHH